MIHDADPVARFARALERYVRGECEAPVVFAVLHEAVEAAPSQRNELLAVAGAARANDSVTEEEWRALAAIVDEVADGHGTGAAEDATRIVSQDAGGDETVVRRPPPPVSRQADTAADDATGADHATTAGEHSSTGSGWTHPERWQGPDAGEIRTGMTIKGRFVLQEVVGRGGMGVVFKALDLRKEEAQDRNPYVAIKVLNEEFKRHPESLKALQREARKSQTLAHPNVVNVFDFDRDGATVFMTMEFLDGQPLNRLLRNEYQSGLAVAEALPIVRGMAQALAYAHKNAVVHSDFKPGNVFLNKDGGVKVFDFGIAQAAKHLDGANDDDHTLFDAGSLGALTPAYASLEMLEGQEPDPRDDIYALGCVAYELLTGRHPFNKLPADEALKQKLQPAPVPGLSRQQQQALNRALAFRRDDRSASVEDFLRELTVKRRSRWPFALAAVLVVAALGGVAAFVVAPNYVSPRKTNDLVTELTSGKPEVVTQALKKLDGLKHDERIIVIQKVRPQLVAYFKTRIADKTDTGQGHYDFPSAIALLKQVRDLYPDSAELTQLGQQLVDHRNQLLDSYVRQLNQRLLEQRLLASGDQPGVDQLLDTIAQIDPTNPLLHDSAVSLAFADAARTALAASDDQRAAAIATMGLQRFPHDDALLSVQDKARIQLGQVDRAALVAELDEKLKQSTPTLERLEDFSAVHDAAVRLAALAPDSPTVADLRARLRPALEAALMRATDRFDWYTANAELQRYGGILKPAFLKQRTQRLATAREQWRGHVTQLEAAFSAALTQGRLAGPDEPNAAALLDELHRIGVDSEHLSWARSSLAVAWLARARAARADGQLADAKHAVEAARAQSVDAALSATLDAEYAAITQAEKTPPAADHWRVMGLHKILNEILEKNQVMPHQAENALAAAGQLAELAPDDPLVAETRAQLPGKLVAAADADGHAGNWRRAQQTLQASVALLPESSVLLQALAHTRTQLRDRNGLAGFVQARKQQQAISDLIATPKFDESWAAELHEQLQQLASELPAGSQWVDDMRGHIAGLYLERIRTSVQEQQFADAGAMLSRARAFADLPAFAEVEKSLKAAEAAQAERNEQQARTARIASLKQTLTAAAKGGDVSAANTALTELRKLMPSDDPFVTTVAPQTIAAAYARLASQRARGHKYADAEKLISAGLKLAPEDTDLKSALARYQWQVLAQQVETALSGDQALNEPGIEAALKKLRTEQPSLYPEAEKRFIAALDGSIQRLAKKTPAAAQRREVIARTLFSRAGSAVASSAGPAAAAGSASPRPCRADLAGYGRRARGTCYDVLGPNVRGPLMVVVPPGGPLSAPLAVSKYEISIAEYNAYCKASGQCKALAGSDSSLPVTNISFKDATRYTQWLSEGTGYHYSIPSVAAWQYAAEASGQQPAGGFNCQVRDGGKLVKGFDLVSVQTGDENGWGLVNYLGNAQEWARDGSGLAALGGSYQDPLSRCQVSLQRQATAAPDPVTGFRVVRSLSVASK